MCISQTQCDSRMTLLSHIDWNSGQLIQLFPLSIWQRQLFIREEEATNEASGTDRRIIWRMQKWSANVPTWIVSSYLSQVHAAGVSLFKTFGWSIVKNGLKIRGDVQSIIKCEAGSPQTARSKSYVSETVIWSDTGSWLMNIKDIARKTIFSNWRISSKANRNMKKMRQPVEEVIHPAIDELRPKRAGCRKQCDLALRRFSINMGKLGLQLKSCADHYYSFYAEKSVWLLDISVLISANRCWLPNYDSTSKSFTCGTTVREKYAMQRKINCAAKDVSVLDGSINPRGRYLPDWRKCRW